MADLNDLIEELETGDPAPQRPSREARPRRQRPEENPALDPRLAQLEKQSTPHHNFDVTLMVVAVAALLFGIFLHFTVAMSVLSDDGDDSNTPDVVSATETPDAGEVAATATVNPAATSTPQPDRTNCDEIRGTQYRSVAEREFFLENCTT